MVNKGSNRSQRQHAGDEHPYPGRRDTNLVRGKNRHRDSEDS